MKTKTQIKSRASEKGQSLVELSVSIVLMLTIVAGVVDLGRALYNFIELRDAAEEAVIYGSAFPTHCDQIAERALSGLNDPTGITVTVEMDGVECKSASAAHNACTGKEIRVSITNPAFPITMPFLGTILGRQTLPLQAQLSGTIMRPACQ